MISSPLKSRPSNSIDSISRLTRVPGGTEPQVHATFRQQIKRGGGSERNHRCQLRLVWAEMVRDRNRMEPKVLGAENLIGPRSGYASIRAVALPVITGLPS